MSDLHLVTDREPGTYYNATDLNRVGRAVRYLADLLVEYGYRANVHPRTDWPDVLEGNIPEDPGTRETALRQYLANIAALRDAYFTLPSTPPLPDSMDYLNYHGANAIERFLADVEQIIAEMVASFSFSDQFYAGENVEIAGITYLGRFTMRDLERYTMAGLSRQTMQDLRTGW